MYIVTGVKSLCNSINVHLIPTFIPVKSFSLNTPVNFGAWQHWTIALQLPSYAHQSLCQHPQQADFNHCSQLHLESWLVLHHNALRPPLNQINERDYVQSQHQCRYMHASTMLNLVHPRDRTRIARHAARCNAPPARSRVARCPSSPPQGKPALEPKLDLLPASESPHGLRATNSGGGAAVWRAWESTEDDEGARVQDCQIPAAHIQRRPLRSGQDGPPPPS